MAVAREFNVFTFEGRSSSAVNGDFLMESATSLPPERHFTSRSVGAGLAVGTVICAANVYFGLQTGWVSIMSMPASIMGFGIFRLLRRHLRFPFSPTENVLLQSVACGMAVMPLGCGFVGVIPAMNYLLGHDEQGPLSLSVAQLITWSLGLCYFGVVFAVPLRRQAIIRERLKFPSGFSTAVLISVLHGRKLPSADNDALNLAAQGGFGCLVPRDEPSSPSSRIHTGADPAEEPGEDTRNQSAGWSTNMRLLAVCFAVSGLYTVCTYFLPFLRNIPIFGHDLAQVWLWTLNPSLAYVGQGIIMGAETTLHMMFGAIVGWGILSPLAKSRGWAPGSVDDWPRGSKGWIVWISLAIMLMDAIVSLGYVALRHFLRPMLIRLLKNQHLHMRLEGVASLPGRHSAQYTPIPDAGQEENQIERPLLRTSEHQNEDQLDAPSGQRISSRVMAVGLVVSVLLCIGTTRIFFGNFVPLYATIVALLMAFFLSIMGVRALGETDLNPVSGISKLAQLFFALMIPQSNQSSVLVNLVVGAISEAGALQAGDLMQDLKTGHLLGASPKAQFWGQVIGSTAGTILSAFLYRLYTRVYTIPGELFQVPTAYVWIFTARLVTGRGLPPMAKEWATAAGILFACTTAARIASVGKSWRPWIPGGISVAIGIYNVPSFTLARAVGGLLGWYWVQVKKRSSTSLIILASGFILGEGSLSIVNLVLQGLQVRHL